MKRRNDAPGAAEFLQALKEQSEQKDPPFYPHLRTCKRTLRAEAPCSLEVNVNQYNHAAEPLKPENRSQEGGRGSL